MENFKNKTIILAVPNHFGLPDVFKKNLEFLGFKVFLIPHDNSKIKLNIKDSLIHFYKKTFKKDKTFKAIITSNKKEKPQLLSLEKIEKADYALVVRPDLFSENILKNIREKSSFSAAYQWDGMSRFPLAEKTIKFFDNFFVFEKEDISRYTGTKHIHNFYFDYLNTPSKIKQDVFFVGTFMRDRINELAKLSEIFQKIGLTTNINVIYGKQKHIEKYVNYPINFTKTGMSFEESINNIHSSNIILDFQNSFHKGLSFRTFEAIGYQKKLITNNQLVKNYDFYDPNNIFVLSRDNFQEIESFIEKNYTQLPKDIYQKYSFTSWIESVLNINNHPL